MKLLRELLTEETKVGRYKVGDYVEWQPHVGKQPQGRSNNKKIMEVLPDNKYRIQHKGKDKIIHHDHILGGNLGTPKMVLPGSENSKQLKEEHNTVRDRFRFTVVVDVDAEDSEKMDEQRIQDEISKAIKKGINSITAFEIQKFIVQ